MNAVRLSAFQTAFVISTLRGSILRATLPLALLPLIAHAQPIPVPRSAPAPRSSTSAPNAAPASNSSPDRIADLLNTLRRVRSPQTAGISPDGSMVAWTVDGDSGSELHLTSSGSSSAPDRILSPDTAETPSNTQPGRCPADHPAWSPDGQQLAFLSGCVLNQAIFTPSSQKNIFLWTRAGNRIAQLTHLKGQLSNLEWSPDGRTLAFLFVENGARRAGALDAMKPPAGVIGEDGIEVQRIAAIELASSGFRFVTVRNLHVYEFSWSPDSEQIVFTAAKPPGENSWWVAGLYLTLVGSGPAEYKQYRDRVCGAMPPGLSCGVGGGIAASDPLVDPSLPGLLHNLQIAVPRFSPDGTQIAFIGGLMSDQGSTGGDIYLIPATRRKPSEQLRDLTPNRPSSPAWIAWRDSHTLLVTEHAGGNTHITAIDTAAGKDDPGLNLTLAANIIAGPDVMDLSLAAHSPDVAVIRSSFDSPPEVWTGRIDHLRQLTHLNDGVLPSWGKAESIEYTHEGFRIQGWLLYPANYDPGRRYPLLVSVHGGPSSAVTPRWPSAGYGPVPFSALGYFVFMPNPRGSFGQGEKFAQANVRDFGYGDLGDILAGLDLLEQRYPIDRTREGITGWSYGGFMTMFAVTQTKRFHAAVAGAGISDWQSYYGENSIDQWMPPFFGATVYDDPAIYARSSPINFVKQVRTPTLMVVGDRDGECPAPQSFEFWHALHALGIKTQLVVYPNEGHRFVDREHQRDVLRRALEWFETNMPPQ